MDNLFCTGREYRLDRCRFDGWGVHDCNHAEAAGVVCDGQRARAISQAAPPEQQAPNAPPPPPAQKTAIRVSKYFLIVYDDKACTIILKICIVVRCKIFNIISTKTLYN